MTGRIGVYHNGELDTVIPASSIISLARWEYNTIKVNLPNPYAPLILEMRKDERFEDIAHMLAGGMEWKTTEADW